MTALRQVISTLQPPAEPRGGIRIDRGDVRAAVLVTLIDRPMNGYEIVRTLEQRGSGARTPGAGSVYPMLQLLVDEGLATAAEEDGRKRYTLTASGRGAAEAARDRAVPAEALETRVPERRGALVKAGAQLAQAITVVGQSGTPGQVADAVAVLDEARRKLYAILARN